MARLSVDATRDRVGLRRPGDCAAFRPSCGLRRSGVGAILGHSTAPRWSRPTLRVRQFQQGNRQDLADIEQAEIEIVGDYLPEQLSDDELNALIEDAISTTGAENIRDMGTVMGVVKAKAQGRADMGVVGSKVKARLSQ